MRTLTLFAGALLAASVGAQTLTTNLHQYYSGRATYTSRGGVASVNSGEILTERFNNVFKGIGDNGTACQFFRINHVLQDQNGLTQEQYRVVARPAAASGDPDTTQHIVRSGQFNTPPRTTGGAVAWGITITFAAGVTVPCANKFYYGVELPAHTSPTWPTDGLGSQGAWYATTAGTRGDEPRLGSPHWEAAVVFPANNVVRPAGGRVMAYHLATTAPVFNVGADIDPTVVTRPNDPNFGAGSAYPDVSMGRRDGLVFRIRAQNQTTGIVLLSGPSAIGPLSLPILSGRLYLDPVTLAQVGTVSLSGSTNVTYAPSFVAQGTLPVFLSGDIDFQAVTFDGTALTATNMQRVNF